MKTKKQRTKKMKALASFPCFIRFSRGVSSQCGGFASILDDIFEGVNGRKKGVQVIEPHNLADAMRIEGY